MLEERAPPQKRQQGLILFRIRTCGRFSWDPFALLVKFLTPLAIARKLARRDAPLGGSASQVSIKSFTLCRHLWCVPNEAASLSNVAITPSQHCSIGKKWHKEEMLTSKVPESRS